MKYHRIAGGMVSAATALALIFNTVPSLAKVGVTSTAAGQPQGKPVDRPVRVLKIGTEVFANERVTTGPGDRTQLLFLDGTALTVGPDSEVVIDNYIYNPSQGTGAIAMTATKGVFRMVGGAITKKNEAEIRTPSGTLGIRGGIVVFSVQPGRPLQASFLFGSQMRVSTAAGTQVATRPGSSITATPGQAPSAPVLASTAAIAQAFGSLEGSQGSGGEAAPPPAGAPPPAQVNSALDSQGVTGSNSGVPGGPPPPPSGSTGGTTSSTYIATVVTQIDNATTETISNEVNNPPPNTPTAASGRLIRDVPYTSFNTATLAAPRDPNRNVGIPTASTVGGNTLTIVTDTQATITVPYQPGAFVLVTAQDSSGTFGPLTGTGFVSPLGDFYAYSLAEVNNDNNAIGFFGGVPTPTAQLPISGFRAQELISMSSTAPFMPEPIASLPAVQGATFSPLYTSFGAGHSGAAMQVSIGIVGQGAAQVSYLGALTLSYISDSQRPGFSLASGQFLGFTRLAASGRIDRFVSAVSSFDTPAGGSIYGQTGEYVVLGPDGIAQSGSTTTRFEQAALAQPSGDLTGAEYYPVALALPIALPSGIGTRRTDRVMGGYAAANVETRLGNGSFLDYSLRNVTPDQVSLTTVTATSSASGTWTLTDTQNAARNVTLQWGANGDRLRSAFIDDQTLAMRGAANGNNSYNNGAAPVNAADRIIAVSQASAPSTGYFPVGVTPCTCEYLTWGYWAGDLRYDVGPRAGERDRIHLATWVAGELPSIAQIPLSGTATYNGHVVANIVNGTNNYVAAGSYQHSWNFATRSGNVTVGNLDGASYTGTASATVPNPRDFSGTLSGAGRSGAIDGSFFRSPGDPVAYQAGTVAITGPGYRATGTFAGQR